MAWMPMLEVLKRGLGTLTESELPDTAEDRGLSSGALLNHCLAPLQVEPVVRLGSGLGTGAE